MKIVIEASPEEIAALASTIQGQPVTSNQEVKKALRGLLKEIDIALCSLIASVQTDL